ncbi:hypothetical protein LG309_07660 [Stutzerimonas chloritidismutans]|uniref:hypothetical protein n=1 Tax=Stutzerimonas stutzeri subgroup TaxID=578833 RepID=UPI001DFED179|nr:hypothetical protein [Stutzerimonas stutzeri]MBU0562989.1 hypothetical protein [Gammaproteobacteria bacterium]MBU0919702.1 hypothetical protein [Gammaproteobacteria bacterium]MBU1807491.1 hypothetical protein [Gammaproteobacteria bacterium]MDH0081351.1 hypothetical protein [Stutzerimonas stutzeri]
MFTTHRHAEIPLAPLFGEPYQLWRFVELEQHRPWFCVTLNLGKGRANWRTMYLVASGAELDHMLEGIAAKAKIEDVQVITPSRLNGAGAWQMEPLAELVRISDTDEKVLGYDLRTRSGAVYSDRDHISSADVERAQIYCSTTT